MIINFTVGNYRSFKDKKVLSMEATAIKELNESVIEKKELGFICLSGLATGEIGRAHV